MATIEEEMLFRHAQEASFLWSQRDVAVTDPVYTLAKLEELDERLEANLAGLSRAGDAGWVAAIQSIDDDPAVGVVFAAAVTALRRRDRRGFARLLDAGAAVPARAREIAAALGWVPLDEAQTMLPALLHERCPPALHLLGIAGATAHRSDPGAPLVNALASSDTRLKARALAAAGELGRDELLDEVSRAAWDAEHDAIRFSAAWSAALLGDPTAPQHLLAVANAGGSFAPRACDMAARVLARPMALAWVGSLLDSKPQIGLVGAAALGDPAIMPRILELMGEPEHARAAGLCFASITGIDLAAEKLRGAPPADHSEPPSDDPADTDVAPHPDHRLPWPDVDKVRSTWKERAARFPTGTRHLLGKPLSPDWLVEVLREGHQRARAAAAIELFLAKKRRPLFEVRASARQQRAQLEAVGS